MTEDEKVGCHHQLNGHELAAGDVLQEMVKDREAWHTALHGVTKSQTGLSDRTTMGDGRIPPHPNKESTSTAIIMLFSSSFLYS